MPDPLRVGLLAADLTHQHGWAHYSVSLVEALRDAGAQVTVVAPVHSPALEGIRMYRLLPTVNPLAPSMLSGQLRQFMAARSALEGCQIVHTAVELYAPLAALVAGSRPLVITGHGTYVRLPRRGGLAGQVYRAAFRRGTLACVSHYTAQEAEKALPGLRTVVIPNGIDAARFEGLPPAEKDGRTVLFVGAVKPRKGVLPLVKAMARVREAIPGARCVIAGSLEQEPGYVAEIRAAIEAHGLQDSVHLLGHTSAADLLPWYASADVFALPSLNQPDGKFEGFGLALLEASAAGLPTIGTLGCGTEDAVRPGETGLLVPQAGLETALAEALITLLKDAPLRASMGAAGRAFARRQTWGAAAAALMGLYEQELGKGAKPPRT